MNKFLISFFLIFNLSAENKNEDQKIDYLLNQIEKFEGVFIRNGKEYPPKKARSHLEFKMNQARSMFWFFGPSSDMTADIFIRKIASKSSSSGKLYKMKSKRGIIFNTSTWLNEKLKKYLKSAQTTKNSLKDKK